MRHKGEVKYDGSLVTYRIDLNPPFKDDKYTVSLDKDASFEITEKTPNEFTIVFFQSKKRDNDKVIWYAGYTDVKVAMFLSENPWKCFIEFNADDTSYSVVPPDRHTGEIEFSRWVKKLFKRPKNSHKLEKKVTTEYTRIGARDYYKTLLNRGWIKV